MTYRAPDYLPPASNLDELIIGWNTLRERGIPLDPGSAGADGPLEWVIEGDGGRWLALRNSGGSNPFTWLSNLLLPATQENGSWGVTNRPTGISFWKGGAYQTTVFNSIRSFDMIYATFSAPIDSQRGLGGSNDVPGSYNPSWGYSVAYELVQLKMLVANLILDQKRKNVLQPSP